VLYKSSSTDVTLMKATLVTKKWRPCLLTKYSLWNLWFNANFSVCFKNSIYGSWDCKTWIFNLFFEVDFFYEPTFTMNQITDTAKVINSKIILESDAFVKSCTNSLQKQGTILLWDHNKREILHKEWKTKQ